MWGDRTVYVSKTGDDMRDGSVRNPVQSIAAALTRLGQSGGAGGTIVLGAGVWVESVVLSLSGLRVIGQGGLPGSGSTTLIQAPNNTATCIELRAQTWLENLATTGNGASWDGIGVAMIGASFSRLVNVRHQNGDNQASSTKGGIGLYLSATEGCQIDQYHGHECRIMVDLADEATENVFITTRGAQNYQDLVIAGASGANSFLHWKTTGCKAGAPFVVDIGGNGSNIFQMADWNESSNSPKVRVASNWNRFIGGVSSPETVMTVVGNNNTLEGWRVLHELDITGNNNVLREPRLNGVAIVNTGTGTVIENETVEAGTITYGTAKRPSLVAAS